MTRAAKPCNAPGCHHLQPCPVPGHTTAPWAGSTRRRRLPPGWDRIRATVLHRHPTCQVCGVAPSTEVDHVEPGDDHGLANLQGICTPCHRAKSAREGQAARA